METYKPNLANDELLSTTDQCLVRIIELLADIRVYLTIIIAGIAVIIGTIIGRFVL